MAKNTTPEAPTNPNKVWQEHFQNVRPSKPLSEHPGMTPPAGENWTDPNAHPLYPWSRKEVPETPGQKSDK